METLDPQAMVTCLRHRYAVKKFDPSRRISDDVWSTLENALILTPSSYGLQPWRFVVITDPNLKSKLPEISWRQNQPKDCSHFVVFAARTAMAVSDVDRYLARISEVRESSMESLAGFRKMMLGSREKMSADALKHWAELQVYIALGQFMSAAAMIGVDTCPMEGIVNSEYDRLLGLPETGYHTVVACAAGYRSGDDAYASIPKVRFPAEEVILRR